MSNVKSVPEETGQVAQIRHAGSITGKALHNNNRIGSRRAGDSPPSILRG